MKTTLLISNPRKQAKLISGIYTSIFSILEVSLDNGNIIPAETYLLTKLKNLKIAFL